jgi:hypothetical protein
MWIDVFFIWLLKDFRSETDGIVVPTFVLGIQYSIFQQSYKNMLAAANVQEAFFLHDYSIFSDIIASLPPLILFLIVLLCKYFLGHAVE